MEQKKRINKVTFPPVIPKMYEKVAIYCRISTHNQEQLKSLSNQVSGLTKKVYDNMRWRLSDVYIDFQSGLEINLRPEFQRMINDCESGLLDIIITKNIGRFGRNTVEALEIIRKLTSCGVKIVFDDDSINIGDGTSELMISLLEAIAQEENENRSQNVYWGIKKRVIDGTSALYNRKCYGYCHDKEGELAVVDEEAETVQFIYKYYLQGASIVGIKKELENRKILSPTGKLTWYNRTIDKMLSNEKYTGDVIVFKTLTTGYPNRKRINNNGETEKYVMIQKHPEIISKEIFEAVQNEKARRCNIIQDDNGKHRTSTKYSSKRKIDV